LDRDASALAAASFYSIAGKVDTMDQREATLNELLSEPIIREVMARDGVRSNDIRKLLPQANARKTVRARWFQQNIVDIASDLT
jgi:hypothetical protein